MLALIQLDSMNPALLDELVAAGRLPTLSGLGASAPRRAVRAPGSGYVGLRWTLHSGRDLSDHGAYYPYYWAPEVQRVRYQESAPLPETFWQRVERAGGRTLVVDAYDAVAPASAAGTYLNGWQFRNKGTLPERFVPRARRRGLVRDFGRAPVVEDTHGQRTAAQLMTARTRLLAAPGRVARAAARLIPEGGYDVCYLSFGSSHLGGHYYWDLDAVPALGATRGDEAILRRALPEIYESIDRALADVLAVLPPDADVIVFAPAVMRHDQSLTDMLPEMLGATLRGGPRPAGADGAAGGVLWRLRAAVPLGAREAVSRALPDRLAIELTARLELARVDWATTPAFVLPSDRAGYVRLNIRGRERDGIVDPADADGLMDRIAEGLLTFVHDDGTPAVDAVHRSRDVVGEGPGTPALPDLVVEWADRQSAGPRTLRSESLGTVTRHGVGSGRSGNHSDDAWMMLLPGRSRVRDLGREPWLVDLAATACHLTGADMEGLSGRSLLEGS